VGILLIFGIVILGVYFISKNLDARSLEEKKKEKELKNKKMNELINNIKSPVSIPKDNDNFNLIDDDSIIDITNNTSYKIENDFSNDKPKISVPSWPNKSISSYEEIDNATESQRKFYFSFKTQFLKNIFYNLDNNENYAFILLFDFLNEYKIHKDFQKLDEQLRSISKNYPKIDSYTEYYLRRIIFREKIYHLKYYENDLHEDLNHDKIKIPLENLHSNDSIIDITNNTSYKIENDFSNDKPKISVPSWPNKSVHSYLEIENASESQRKFYFAFKAQFLENIFYDLDNNENYAFLLLFDFLRDYNIHKDSSKLKNCLNKLSENYPFTKSFNQYYFNKISKEEEYYQVNNIITNSELVINKLRVPLWSHRYVYSYSEINCATKEQKEFYGLFKNKFLTGEYLDLENNSNYAFILLFDLLDEYEKNKNIFELEKMLKTLGANYSITNSYCKSFLIERMERVGDFEGIARLKSEESHQSNYRNTSFWRLGNRYKSKLNLSSGEVELLNNVSYSGNNFSNIEFCFAEIIKIFILLISNLNDRYTQDGTSLKQEFAVIGDIIARKHFRYKNGSNNYKYCIESTFNDIYSNIFKHCENVIRDYYIHKRKINTDLEYTSSEIKEEYDKRVITQINSIFPRIISTASPLDEATEIELNSKNTTRWKIKFDDITNSYKDDPKQFTDNILVLCKLNKENPSVENICYEASKFIAKYDREAALSLYIRYLYQDLQSSDFDNKQLTKTIQKNLFKTNEQLQDFESVVSDLIKDKNLDKALAAISHIYETKRKKIQLDMTSIKEVQQKHVETVDLLNEYLKDEYDDESINIKTQEISNEEIKMQITPKAETSKKSIYLNDMQFSPIQIEIFEVFKKNSLSILQSEFEMFAKAKGAFKNQLIESINEICFEILDDNIIEEDEEYYTINENYYQRILAV